MVSLWGLLKASKGIPPKTPLEALWASRAGISEVEYVGAVPFEIKSKSRTASGYTIWGDIQQNGTPTPEAPVEVLGVGNRTDNGCEIPVVSRGKNLFDFKTIYSDSSKFAIDGNSVSSEGAYFHDMKIKLIDLGLSIGDTFCFSAMIKNNPGAAKGLVATAINGKSFNGHYLDTTSPYMSVVSQTVVTVDDEIFISYGTRGTITASDIQLELGTEPTEYEPYREPITTPIYLPEPLYKGDYITKDKSGRKVHRAWGVKVFDGTEEITLHKGFDSHASFRLPIQQQVRGGSVILSTHVENIDFKELLDNGRYGICSYPDGDRSWLYIAIPNVKRLDDMKYFLEEQYAKGTPVTVYYPLAEPTEESIELPDISLEIGYNTIDVDTEIKPEKMSITYKADKAAAQADEALTNEFLNLMEEM